MKTSFLVLVALLFVSSPVVAQVCVGLPAEGPTHISLGVSHTDLSRGLSHRTVNATYARQINIGFEPTEDDASEGWLRVGLSTGSYNAGGERVGDTSIGLSAHYSVAYDTGDALPPPVSVCGTTGLTLSRLGEGASYMAVPLSLSAGYTVPLGDRTGITPFLSPTLSSYLASFEDDVYRYTEKGLDFYVDAGVALNRGRFTASGVLRLGDYEFAEHSRFQLSAGVSF